jgi:ribonuclease P protein component
MPHTKTLGRAEFKSFKPLTRQHGKFFVLGVGRSETGPRYACVVSKKVALRANQRNLIKRRCRAAIREVALAGKYAYVFTAKRAALEATYQEILSDIRTLSARV